VAEPPLATAPVLVVNVTVGAAAPATLTVAVTILLVPAGPLQVREYEVVCATGPVLMVPLVASAPLQPPEAVHAEALLELQVSVAALPEATAVGLAASVAIGTTLIPALITGLTPPGPVQVNTNVEFLVRGPVLCVPLGANVPLQALEAVHEVASVELHVRVAEPPLGTAPVLVIRAAVGTAAAALFMPLAAMQIKVNAKPNAIFAARIRIISPKFSRS
jgi:hypothetical protein